MNQAKIFAKAMENFNDGLSNVKQVSQMLQEQEESMKNINTRVSKVEQKEDESIKKLEIRVSKVEQKEDKSIKKLEIRLSKLENEGLKRKRNEERETNKRFKQMESSVQQRIDTYLSAKSDAETSEQSKASNNTSSQTKTPQKHSKPSKKKIKLLEFNPKQQREHSEQLMSTLLENKTSSFYFWRKIPISAHAMIALVKIPTKGQPYYEVFPHQASFGAFCKHWLFLQDAIKYRDQIFKIIGIKLQFNEQMTHYKLIKS